MGAGIAQVAAGTGWNVWLMDIDDQAVRVAIDGVTARFDRLVEKDRLTVAERDAAVANLNLADRPGDFESCSLFIEAIVENINTKARVMSDVLDALPADCILASNTSSLSITDLGNAIGQPHRTVGMHFFNPAPLMKLVEVIAGQSTNASVVERTAAIAKSWGKQVARAADVPGFIVNHVARPYYLEAFRIMEDQLATADDIDTAMKQLGGFRMGPLELTDLIGQDVNTATTRSVWEQLDQPPLLHPSKLQESLVADGKLGRKSGRGVYDYAQKSPQESINIRTKKPQFSHEMQSVLEQYIPNAIDQKALQAVDDSMLNCYIFARILTAIIVQAHHANSRGVAEREDIDIAMKFGVNYPHGPFEWASAIGDQPLTDMCNLLNQHTSSERFMIAHD